MLHRSLSRSVGAAPSSTICATCVCTCGRRFVPTASISLQQKRYKRAPEASNAVYQKERNSQRRRVITPKQKQEQRLQEAKDQEWHLRSIARAVRIKLISVDIIAAAEFLKAFSQLCDQTKYPRPGTIPVNREDLEGLIAELEISEKDGAYLARALLLSPKNEHHVYGKKLLYSLSHLGQETATLQIMKQLLAEGKRNKAKLNVQEIQPMRKHLKEIADKGENFRAMVLQGKLESLLGNQNAAIQVWTDAMASAVAYAEELAEMKANKRRKPNETKMAGSEFAELDSPWIDLAAIHIARREWAKARWAISIGCEMDDPTSHYYAAGFERRTDPETGMLIAKSGWLYHMTKAAASGHPKAAHELGYFYGHSLWPYLEDEPPDDVKPTPFDRYPPERPNIGNQGLFDQVQHALGLKSTDAPSELEAVEADAKPRWRAMVRRIVGLDSRSEEAPTENIFKTAMFPSDPKSRMLMAIEWFNIACSKTYAPSHLLSAQLRLEKTLWAEASTPRAALNMTDERYTYASKADYDAGREIERPEKDENQAEKELPNPYYSPETAYWHIVQVFHANTAQRAHGELADLRRRARRHGMKVDSDDLEEFLTESAIEGAEMSWGKVTREVSLFFRFPEVREMYSDDTRGLLFDDLDSDRRDIVAAAKEICEEQRWDVYDENGGLIYKYGLAKPKPDVATAAGSGR